MSSVADALFALACASMVYYGAVDLADVFPFVKTIETELAVKKGESDVLINKHMPIFAGATVAYMVLVLFGEKIVGKEPIKSLKLVLPAWSLVAWIFSFACTVQLVHYFRIINNSMGPEVNTIWKVIDFYTEASCNQVEEMSKLSGANQKLSWVVLFAYSKPFEFIDTIFLVGLKKPVRKLHWWHHLITMWFSWFNLAIFAPPGILFSVVNAGVHTIMYCWYFLASIGFKPKGFAMIVTGVQLLQMFFGFAIPLFHYPIRNQCSFFGSYFAVTIAMYGFYIYLFSDLFYTLYIAPKEKKVLKPQKKLAASAN